ncbi:MAG: lysophospholipase [Pseudomonadota bacterium]
MRRILSKCVLLGLAILSAGCAQTRQAIGPALSEPRLSAEAAIMADGAVLPLQTWLPQDRELQGVFIGVHGMNDYSGAFALPGPFFAGQGYGLYAYDQRGFGAAPRPGIWAGHRAMTDDLKVVAGLVADRHPGVPIYLLGLSMGGGVSLLAIDASGPKALHPAVEGAVLVAPAVWGWRTMNPFYRVSLWSASKIAPGKTLSGSRLEIWPSDNIDVLRALSRDPLVIKETRVDAISGLVSLMDEAYGSPAEAGRPVLMLYGKKDEIIPRRPIETVSRRLPCSARFAEYANGFHMLLRDKQRERVWRDILAWAAAPGEPLPSGEMRPHPNPDCAAAELGLAAR